jgi:hypothetical protein
MSETRIFQTETRPRREVSASREIENKTRREMTQILKYFCILPLRRAGTSNDTSSKVYSRPNLTYLTEIRLSTK